jgi:hypothetical protein
VLEWTDNSSNETGFRLERSPDGASFNLLASLPADTSQFTDASTQAGGTYFYRLRAFNATRTSDWSAILSVSVPSAPNLEIHVDLNYTGTIEDGTTARPYKTVARGFAAASNGAKLLVHPGDYHEGNLVLAGKPVRLVAASDKVTVQP